MVALTNPQIRAFCFQAQTDPLPLEYLRDPEYGTSAFDIRLDASIQGSGMLKPETVTRYASLSRSCLRHDCLRHQSERVHSGPGDGQARDCRTVRFLSNNPNVCRVTRRAYPSQHMNYERAFRVDPEYGTSAFDIRLQASIQGPRMLKPETVSRYASYTMAPTSAEWHGALPCEGSSLQEGVPLSTNELRQSIPCGPRACHVCLRHQPRGLEPGSKDWAPQQLGAS